MAVYSPSSQRISRHNVYDVLDSGALSFEVISRQLEANGDIWWLNCSTNLRMGSDDISTYSTEKYTVVQYSTLQLDSSLKKKFVLQSMHCVCTMLPWLWRISSYSLLLVKIQDYKKFISILDKYSVNIAFITLLLVNRVIQALNYTKIDIFQWFFSPT